MILKSQTKNLTDSQRDRRSLENKQTNKQNKQPNKQTKRKTNRKDNLQGLWKVSYHIVLKRLLIISSRVDVKWLLQTTKQTNQTKRKTNRKDNLQGLWKVSYHIVLKRLLIISSRVDVKWLLNSYIPRQIFPSPVNPRLQVQFAEPSVLIQTAFSSHGLEPGAHSLMSEKTYAKKL